LLFSSARQLKTDQLKMHSIQIHLKREKSKLSHCVLLMNTLNGRIHLRLLHIVGKFNQEQEAKAQLSHERSWDGKIFLISSPWSLVHLIKREKYLLATGSHAMHLNCSCAECSRERKLLM
jgi:hypothetical protein